MKKYLTLLLSVLCCIAYSQKITIKGNLRSFTLPLGVKSTDYIHNTVIVKYKMPIQVDSNINFSSQQNLKTANLISVKKKFPDNKCASIRSDTTLAHSFSANNTTSGNVNLIYEFEYKGDTKIEDIINEILQDENVEYAEPKYISHIMYVPNDPRYPELPYLNQVMAPQAWNIIKNASTVIIAIVDNGSEVTHQDLVTNIYLNTSDPINGKDDDQDGYIDNYYGWDLGGNTSSNGIEDNDPNVKDASGNHGIHVSGLASAVSDNSIGISSIASNAKLMIVKAAADDDENTIYKGYEGIKYAADHGAQIINCSWGSNAGGSYGQDIINYALNKNCLIVAASGNSNDNNPVYPAAYPGVLAVANVQGNDVKAETSSYGSYVGISAPGTNILSTFFNNSYGMLSGTSMSTPIVSSAAALVKAYFPALTMQQVGERLRVTADNIDTKNPGLKGQLGKGRLNVFAALTQSMPSIRNQKLTVTGNVSKGDTIEVYLNLKNFLDPATAVVAKLTANSPFVNILNAKLSVGDLATLQTKNMVGPFRIIILSSTPVNSLIGFQINYSANNNSYIDFEKFSLPVATDYLDIKVNNVNTTMTSNGHVGFTNGNAGNGLGFLYKNQNFLYEASLMIGNSPNAISNNARNTNGSDNDFVDRISAKQVINSSASFEGRASFDDSASPNPLNLYINHRQIAYSKAPDDKYTIIEYVIINKSIMPLDGVYMGLYTDWDVSSNGNDITRYDPLNKLGYTYGKVGNTAYLGVKLLSNNFLPLYYPLTTTVPGNPLSNGFTRPDKYLTLTKGIKSLSLGQESPSVYDVSFVSGYGPFHLGANDSVKFAFAFLAGDNLTDLENSAYAAQNKYLSIAPDRVSYSLASLKQNFPNPANNNTLIQFSIPNTGLTTLDVYNIRGQKITTLVNNNLFKGTYAVNMNVDNIPPGIYIYKLRFNSSEMTKKMIVLK